MAFQHMSCEQLLAMINDVDTPEQITIIDIRDKQSYQQGHIKGAIHLDNSNVDDFLMRGDKSVPLVVCCYHGNSSQGAADFFGQQGFHQTYSLDGGYEYWKTIT